MEINDELKEIVIENCTCCYFVYIIDFSFNKILSRSISLKKLTFKVSFFNYIDLDNILLNEKS